MIKGKWRAEKQERGSHFEPPMAERHKEIMDQTERKLLYLSELRHATWLELFFDLIFVVALGKLTHLLAHTHHGHLAPGVWFHFILAFVPMWWIWVGHTVYSNRFDADTRRHRIATLFLMFLIMLASVHLGEEIIHNHVPFVIIYCFARLFISWLYFSAARRHQEKAKFAKRTGNTFMVGALISASSAFMELPGAIIVFYVGILFDMVGRRFFIGRTIPIDREHLVERVGLLAIILLGESVISLSGGMTDMTWDTLTAVTAVFGFVFICMIWWIYFDSFPFLINSRRDIEGDAILYSQLFTYLSFATLANMIRHAILNDLNIEDFRIMVMAGMVMLYLGKQTAYFVNTPEYRPYIVLNTMIVLGISGLSLLLLTPQYILFGVSFSMVVYILMNYWAQIRLYGKVRL